jgi:hypothetical protein
MAIISAGRVLLLAEPARAVQELEGRIWRKAVAREELAAHEAELSVISTRLVAGKKVIHVLADERPGPGFEPARSDLEDVYFATLKASRAA